jgi:type II secretory pathway pseudopilin PulG
VTDPRAPLPPRRFLRLPARGDAGFGMVEAVVSLSIIAVLLTSLAFVLITATRAGVVARTDQQASNLLNQQIESVRSLDYAAVTMRSGDASIATDPAISSGTYLPTGEPLAVEAVGSVQHQLAPITRDNTTYTVRRYVTEPAGTTGYKRVTVVVTWTSAGGPRERSLETFVTATQRGLPLPRFEVRLNGSGASKTVGADTEIAWGFAVRNLGARDSWNITASSGTWTFVVDDGDGIRQAGETTALADTDGNGQPDTGLVETTQTRYVIAYRTVGATEASPQNVTFTFTSASQPPPLSDAKTVTTEMTVTGSSSGGVTGVASCPALVACTLTPYHLDQANNGDRSAVNPNPLSEGAISLQTSIFNYSTNYPVTGQGRALATSTDTALNQVHRLMEHRYQVPNGQSRSYQGVALVEVWVTCPAGRAGTLTAELGSSAHPNGAFVSKTTASSVFTCAGPAQVVGVELPLATPLTLPAKDSVVLRTTVTYAGATDPVVRVLYDMSSYDSVLTLPRL